MPRSAAGKAKRLRQNDDNTDDDEEELEEGEEEEKEEETRIEDIVRTKFEGDAHRALFCHDRNEKKLLSRRRGKRKR